MGASLKRMTPTSAASRARRRDLHRSTSSGQGLSVGVSLQKCPGFRFVVELTELGLVKALGRNLPLNDRVTPAGCSGP